MALKAAPSLSRRCRIEGTLLLLLLPGMLVEEVMASNQAITAALDTALTAASGVGPVAENMERRGACLQGAGTRDVQPVEGVTWCGPATY